jgi:hypothetical protein
MMAGQRGVREIVEAILAVVAKIALSMRLSVVMSVAHDMFAPALWTANALQPTRLTHKFETFRVIEQRRQIDQNAHGSNLSRISREPYGFRQKPCRKAIEAESFRCSALAATATRRFITPERRVEATSKATDSDMAKFRPRSQL